MNSQQNKPKKSMQRQIIIKLLKTEDKVLKVNKRKMMHCQGKTIKIIVGFSPEIAEAKIKKQNIFKW